jgi:hypothetical protein
MITSTTRAMTAQEQAQVVNLLQVRPFEMIDLVSGCLRFVIIPLAGLGLGALLVIPVSMICRQLPDPLLASRIGYTLCFLLGVGASVLYLLHDARQGTRFRDPFERSVAEDLHAGIVEEQVSKVVDVMIIEADADNEPALILDLGDGNMLFLQGAYLKAKMMGSKPELPRSQVKLVRLPHTGLLLNVQGSGDVLVAAWKRGPLDPAKEYQPDDGEILNGSLVEMARMDAEGEAAVEE